MTITPLLARCPHCGTSFKVTIEQLSVANGAVRCGSCFQVFAAQNHEINQSSTVLTEEDFKKSYGLEDADEKDMKIINSGLDNQGTDSNLSNNDQEIGEQKANTIDDSLKATSQNNTNDEVLIEQQEIFSVKEDDLLEVLKYATDDHSDSLDNTENTGISDNNPQYSDFFDNVNDYQLIDLDTAEPYNTVNINIDDILNGDVEIPDQDSNNYAEKNISSTSENSHEILLELPEEKQTEQFSKLVETDKNNKKDVELTLNKNPNNEENITENFPLKEAWLNNIEPEPVEIKVYQKRSLWWTLTFMVLNVMVLCSLFLQYAWVERAHFARDQHYRPWFKMACVYLKCQLPEMVDIQKIKVTKLTVRYLPGNDQVLILDAVINNKAAFDQVFPLLELSFSDINSHLLAQRIFQPADYLGGEAKGLSHMPSLTPVRLSLEILSPGPDGVSYTLRPVRKSS